MDTHIPELLLQLRREAFVVKQRKYTCLKLVPQDL
jgi:hypothetical protein